ncbi:hypothetical protein [Thalassoroseus pseudoceratinae]|uniref:hypothetical protein n=1 Tax=Thalassoroseus pseudoceratinae TaxID=2713176 RepID=UPI0014221723|nr:hypothetical protein [Thalassoroseus pseudoceratinae]
MRLFCFAMTVFSLSFLPGCGGGVQEKEIEVKASNDPLNEPRAILKRYAEGQPFGSEITSFPDHVANVREIDPERADILEKGIADLQAAPAGKRKAIAKELLGKLAPSMGIPSDDSDGKGTEEASETE